jgi:hypothetical protein
MSRIRTDLLDRLTLDDLRQLAKARGLLDKLQARRARLVEQLAKVDTEIAAVESASQQTPPTRGRKPSRKKTGRPRKATAKKAGTKKGRARKGRRKVAARKSAARIAKRTTLESVVLDVLKANGGTMPFKAILTEISSGKLYRSKAANFEAVLRQTLRTSSQIKRVGRGVYEAVV